MREMRTAGKNPENRTAVKIAPQSEAEERRVMQSLHRLLLAWLALAISNPTRLQNLNFGLNLQASQKERDHSQDLLRQQGV